MYNSTEVDPVRNPYTPGAGTRPAELAGRDGELEAFRVLVARLRQGAPDQSQIIRGLRGVGKTVLLNSFEDHAEAEGFLTAFRELNPSSSIADLLAKDVRRALTQLSLSKQVAERVRALLKPLRAFTLKDPAGYELTVDLRRAADETTLAEDLTDLLLALGEALASKGTGFILFLDEVQFIKGHEFRAIISALHRVTQKSLPVSLAAAGLPQIPRLAGEARSYAERLFTFPAIGPLADADARSALVLPAERRGASYQEQAVARTLELTAGYPFYLQQFGKHIWNLAKQSPITPADVEAAAPLAEQALDRSIYEVRVQRATEKERRYLRAMAELGPGPYRVGSVAKKMGSSTTKLSRVRQNLLDKGLIYATEDYGHIAFTVPRFDEFMRRYLPYKKPTSSRSRTPGKKRLGGP